MDINIAQDNMLKQQIHACRVDDPDIMDAMTRLPRDQFVPKMYQNIAFADVHIPIGQGQTMLLPMQEARILKALKIQPGDNMLEIGTGSGYFTALLAQFAAKVYSVELFSELLQRAEARLNQQKITNIELIQGNGAYGHKPKAPYDVIVITGSLPYLPNHFRHQLRCGGRLFCIIGQEPIMQALLITRCGEDRWTETCLFETDIKPLSEITPPAHFVL